VLSGNLKVPPNTRLGVIVIGLALVTLRVVPTIVILPVEATEVKVIVSVAALVVIAIPVPATNVSVSVAVSAITVGCPDTTKLVKLGEVEKSNPLLITFQAVPLYRHDF
jgi:hypothetical protein